MSNTPTKIVTPFGLDSTNIDAYPTGSPDITGLSAPEGFPANYMTTGGDKPRGQLFNRLLFDVTYWVREFLSGRTPRYDAAYQTLLGGYDADATVMGDDGETIYLSTANNNMTNPNSGGAGWKIMSSSANIISQVDAEAGVATVIKSWTAQRVRQAIVAYVTGGYAISLTANGYIKLPSFLGGLIIQWGASGLIPWATLDLIPIAVSLNINYPTAHFQCVITAIDSDLTPTSASVITEISLTNFKIRNSSLVSTVFRWISVGY